MKATTCFLSEASKYSCVSVDADLSLARLIRISVKQRMAALERMSTRNLWVGDEENSKFFQLVGYKEDSISLVIACETVLYVAQ